MGCRHFYVFLGAHFILSDPFEVLQPFKDLKSRRGNPNRLHESPQLNNPAPRLTRFSISVAVDKVIIESDDHALFVEHLKIGEVDRYSIVNSEAFDIKSESFAKLLVCQRQSLLLHQDDVLKNNIFVQSLITEINETQGVC